MHQSVSDYLRYIQLVSPITSPHCLDLDCSFAKNGHREITMDYFSSRGCFFSLSINLQTKLFILPFSSITLSTRDGENPIPIKDDLKLLPDELAMFS